MASLHHVNTSIQVGRVTITVRGKSSCQISDLNRLAYLLAEVMNDLAFEGEYTVTPQRRALPGSQSQKGLSVDGTNHNLVGIGFQPGGNSTRARYDLYVADAQDVFRKLKDYIGTAYNGKDKPKLASKVALVATEEVQVPPSSDEKPVEAPKVYFTQDADKMETLILQLDELADKQPEKQLSKSQVLNLIFETAKLEKRLFTGPIFKVAKDRGYIVPVEGLAYHFTVVTSPTPSVKKSKKTKASKKPKSSSKPKAPAVEAKPRNKSSRKWYLNDEAWVSMCIAGLSKLVADKNGLLSHKDLTTFVQSNTEPRVRFGALGAIMKGLTTKGILYEASAKRYRFAYNPSGNLPQKALAVLEHDKAGDARVFDGFAKYRLPDFAEGMMLNGKSLLREFLRKVQDGIARSTDLHKVIEEWYPGLHVSTYIRLFNYLIGQGYLVRPKYGTYTLGPSGLSLLGLSPVTYTTVTKEVLVAEAPPTELVIPATETVAEPIQTLHPFIPEKLLVTKVPIVPGMAEAAARTIAKAVAKKAEADAMVEKEAKLIALRDELRAGPSPEAVEVAFMEKLVEMANAL